jgi:hypothetical protein
VLQERGRPARGGEDAAERRGVSLGRLEDLDLAVLVLDRLHVAQHWVVVALGIAVDGSKRRLGIWQGSSDSARLCSELLQDLLSRWLRMPGGSCA